MFYVYFELAFIWRLPFKTSQDNEKAEVLGENGNGKKSRFIVPIFIISILFYTDIVILSVNFINLGIS